MKVRKIFSVLIAFAMFFSLAGVNVFADTINDTNEPDFQHVEYDYVEELPDGGKIYTYLIDGVTEKYPVPPNGFSPLTATDEQLSTYGFPARPDTSDAEAYDSWVSLMIGYEGTPIPSIEVRERPVSDEHVYSSTVTRATTIYNDHWSGYISDLGANSSKFYTQVQMDYTQPKIKSTSGTCGISYWVGLGGGRAGSSSLVQAGTASRGLYENYAWFELVGDSKNHYEQKIENLAINAGDEIHVYVAFQAANNIFNCYIVNKTTGKHQSIVLGDDEGEMDADYPFDGTTVEWVVERPSYSYASNPNVSYLYNLPNYGNVTLTNCKAMLNTSNTWDNLNSLTNLKRCVMENKSGQTLSTPSTISSNNQFTCTWARYN